MSAPVCEYIPGLANVPAAQSSISYVDGQKGILEYRGLRIEELAQKSTFLETSFLLIWGYLPSKEELKAFETEILYHRRIKYRIRDMMKCFPETGLGFVLFPPCLGRSPVHPRSSRAVAGKNSDDGRRFQNDAQGERSYSTQRQLRLCS
jgi:Citrate synthase, C-terminal domain